MIFKPEQIQCFTTLEKYQYSYNLLHEGYYEQGFELFEYRWHPDVIATLPQPFIKYSPAPVWQGQSLYGKNIVVQMEMGYGDCIQWYRYLPMLKALGAGHVTVVQTKSLHNLIGQMGCIDHITNNENSFTVKFADFWVGSMSLSHRAHKAPKYIRNLFPTERDNIVGQNGYLDADPYRLDGAIKIGVNWEAGPRHLYNIKSMDVEMLIAIQNKLPDLHFYSFNPKNDSIFNPLPNSLWKEDWSETARFMKSMDMIVTVDTGTAHLAGALNVPCIVLAPDDDKYLCWRWKNTSWYNSVKVYRQKDTEKIIKTLENYKWQKLQPGL